MRVSRLASLLVVACRGPWPRAAPVGSGCGYLAAFAWAGVPLSLLPRGPSDWCDFDLPPPHHPPCAPWAVRLERLQRFAVPPSALPQRPAPSLALDHAMAALPPLPSVANPNGWLRARPRSASCSCCRILDGLPVDDFVFHRPFRL